MTATPVSLYLDLQEGEKADIEVVARASLAFAAAVKDVAYVLDPSLELRIELASGTEGSLSLNSLLKLLRGADGKELTIAAVAATVLLWFANHALDWTFDEIMDAITGKQQPVAAVHLSQDDINQIAGQVKKAMDGKVAQQHVQRVYRELERDKAIKGVGATQTPGAKPASIVPRSDFSVHGGHTIIKESLVPRRERISAERVTLISPVLLPGTRRWRFSSHEGEFGAPIKDQAFLDDLTHGRISIPMTSGIEMDVQLKTIEEQKDGVWIVVERDVLHVGKVFPPPVQRSLGLVPPPSDGPSGDKK